MTGYNIHVFSPYSPFRCLLQFLHRLEDNLEEFISYQMAKWPLSISPLSPQPRPHFPVSPFQPQGAFWGWDMRQFELLNTILQTFSGLSQDFLKTLSGLSQGYLKTFTWFSQDLPRTFPGLSQDFPRTLSGLSKDFLRYFIGLFQDFFRTVSGYPKFGPDCLGLVSS